MAKQHVRPGTPGKNARRKSAIESINNTLKRGKALDGSEINTKALNTTSVNTEYKFK